MTDTVVRFISAHAAATGANREYADAFVSTRWAIAELAEALNLARHRVNGLHAAAIEESLGRMFDAQRELDRLLAQSMQLSETIARVLKAHAARGGGM